MRAEKNVHFSTVRWALSPHWPLKVQFNPGRARREKDPEGGRGTLEEEDISDNPMFFLTLHPPSLLSLSSFHYNTELSPPVLFPFLFVRNAPFPPKVQRERNKGKKCITFLCPKRGRKKHGECWRILGEEKVLEIFLSPSPSPLAGAVGRLDRGRRRGKGWKEGRC